MDGWVGVITALQGVPEHLSSVLDPFLQLNSSEESDVKTVIKIGKTEIECSPSFRYGLALFTIHGLKVAFFRFHISVGSIPVLVYWHFDYSGKHMQPVYCTLSTTQPTAVVSPQLSLQCGLPRGMLLWSQAVEMELLAQ